MEALFSNYEEVRKSGLFDDEYYLARYPDVAARNVDPLVHFLEEGGREGRDPHPEFDSAFYFEQCQGRGERPDNPLLHYLRIGAARGFKTRRETGERGLLPAGDEPAWPATLVAIEALATVGNSDGSSRLTVAGWALAAEPIVEVALSFGELALASALYGLARPDIADFYPDRPDAGTSGFIIGCELPRLVSGTIEPLLIVRTQGGEIGRQALRVAIPPTATPPDGAGLAPLVVGIDRALVEPHGVLRVEGWVVSPVQVETIEVSIDDAVLGPAELGWVRPDIEERHPDYPNARFSGFRFVGHVGGIAGGRSVAVAARGRAGVAGRAEIAVDIPAGAVPATADGTPHSHCEEVALTASGWLAVRGWAFGPSLVRGIAAVVGGVEFGAAEIGLARPEIGNLFPHLPQARRSGFALLAQIGRPLLPGEAIQLALRGADGERHLVPVPSAGLAQYAKAPGFVEDADHKLHIDTPESLDRDAPVRGNLQISGWALARSGVAEIAVALDGVPHVFADYGLRRLDIRSAYPDWPDALGSGFTAVIPHRMLAKGRHQVGVTLRDRNGGTVFTEFGIVVEEIDGADGPWSLRCRMPPAEAELGLRLLEGSGRRPQFIIILPMRSGTSPQRVEVTIQSLRAQVYLNWRLIVVPHRTSERPSIADERVSAVRAADLPALVAGAQADAFVAVLAPGDELGIDALLELALAAAREPAADFFYSDERCPNPATGAVEAFFKPQWSPDLLLATNYIGRLWCARAALLRRIADPRALLGRGEYDLLLRCTEVAESIRHVPAVLCERADAAIDGPAQTKAAVTRALARRGIAGADAAGRAPGSHRIKRALAEPGLVSIVIPTCAAQGLIETCIATLRRLTAYREYEIVCVENISPEGGRWRQWLARNADRVIPAEGPFNWSRFNNLAAAEARGRYLLFLNDDVEITDPDWLDVLVGEAQRPEVGVVGPRLLYPDGRVQHAGMFLAAMGQGRHAFRYKAEDDPGYFGLALTQRNVIAVTGACLITKRATFEALGGFDEAQSVVNNDLDYCLRAWRAGLLNVYTPHATLIHHEAASRAALADTYDEAAFDDRWRDLFVAGDPYHHPHLAKSQDDLAIDYEPTRLLVTGRPALPRAEIRQILALKLDHIGDCVIAFPAVRRLKQHFPDARITVLTSRASRPVWSLEPSVDATIEFDFFHARSGLGELDHSEAEWQELRDRLAAERFDLAIDLRKHTETRPVLRHSGARWLAGFDFRDQFPWLDIALEWSGDLIYARKHQHNGDDLLNLVDAVAAACDRDRSVIAPRPLNRPAVLPALRRAAGSGPLVCVHPAVGNDARQWPPEYFASVIDRLIANDGAHIVLIGAPGDEPVAADIMARVRRPKSISSMIGRLPLAELPGLLAGASLFLGNNSGPKHIAAGLGVPTVGIHSGTEDVREWGPIGPNAIAVAREVVCAPCYLAAAQDCRRGLACLRELHPAHVYDACRRLLLAAARPKRKRRSVPAG